MSDKEPHKVHEEEKKERRDKWEDERKSRTQGKKHLKIRNSKEKRRD